MRITWIEWIEKYKPHKNNMGQVIAYETYGADHQYCCDFADKNGIKHFWTLISEDDSDAIVAGYRWVNRINHFITEIPFKETDECYVVLNSDKEEDIHYNL